MVWLCGSAGCGGEVDASQLPLAKEAELEEAVLRMCCSLSEVEFRSALPAPVLWKLAWDCQEHLSERHWTRTAALAALMRTVADDLLEQDLSRTTQQIQLQQPDPTGPGQARESGEGAQCFKISPRWIQSELELVCGPRQATGRAAAKAMRRHQ